MRTIHINTLLLTSLLLFSCSTSKNEFEKLNTYFETRHDVSLRNKKLAVFVLTNEGCPTCSRSLAMLMEKRMKDMENTLFLITTSQYVQFYTSDLNNTNVLVDENISFVEEANGLFNTSMVFYVGENELDTLIELNASMLQAQIDYIANH